MSRRGAVTPPVSTPDTSTDLDTAYVAVVRDVLAHGRRVAIGKSLSIASEQETLELLNYSFDLRDPQNRLLFNPVRRFNLTSAVGRFMWMMSASDRLSDIEYYDSDARRFSDDDLTVPGSSDGARLLQPEPGLNQITNLIDLLKRERNTRRGAATVYQPLDAGRRSRDIPCTLAVVYNVREDELHATTVMRANNALTVLPHDVFQFSLLAELVAACVGVKLVHYHQFAASMHIYQRDRIQAEEVISAPLASERAPMPPMPIITTWDEIGRLLQFELSLRMNYKLLDDEKYASYLRQAEEDFDPYWRDFALILLFCALQKTSSPLSADPAVIKALLEKIRHPYRSLLAPSFGSAPTNRE